MRRKDKETRKLISDKMKKCIICEVETQEFYCCECFGLSYLGKLGKLIELAKKRDWSRYTIYYKIEDIIDNEIV